MKNPPVPMCCSDCGAIFRTRSLWIADGPEVTVRSFTVKGDSETCPFCGGTAYVANELLDYIAKAIESLSKPMITQQSLRELVDLLERAKRDGLQTDSVASEASKIEPSFGDLFRPFSWSPSVKAAMIGAVAVIAAAIITSKQNPIELPLDSITPISIVEQLEVNAEMNPRPPKRPNIPIPKPKPLPPTPGGPNRAERRRMKALSRRRKPQS